MNDEEAKKRKITMATKMSTPPTLCNLPNELAVRIFNRVGFKSIQNLRKVCHDLRNRIDDIKPEANVLSVFICVTDCEIRFVYYSKLRTLDVEESEDAVEYEKTEESGRSIVRSDGSEKIVNGDFMELALRDFLLILKFQKQRIKSITFNNRNKYSNHFLQFLETLKSFLAFKNRLLKVIHFNINAIDQKSVITSLSLIDPQSIYRMTLADWDGSIQPMEFPKIMEMEQWKSVKHFKSDYRITGVSAHNFRHFSRVELKFRSISSEELLEWKNIFQNSTKADMFQIRCDTFVDRELFFEKMGLAVRTRLCECVWFFRMSTTSDYVWTIERIDRGLIMFSRKAVANVPAHAVIQS